MTQLTHFTDPTADLTEHERNLLRGAGADEKLIRVCLTSLDDLDADRHSVLMEVKKYTREWNELTEDTAQSFNHYGGGFFAALWNGELWGAYTTSDTNNREIMEETFGIARINADRPAGAAPIQV